jgi:hypothetical protein
MPDAMAKGWAQRGRGRCEVWSAEGGDSTQPSERWVSWERCVCVAHRVAVHGEHERAFWGSGGSGGGRDDVSQLHAVVVRLAERLVVERAAVAARHSARAMEGAPAAPNIGSGSASANHLSSHCECDARHRQSRDGAGEARSVANGSEGFEIRKRAGGTD